MPAEQLDTPCVIIDTSIVEKNIRLAQEVAGRLGLQLRPHIKTHKLPELAKQQLAAGAAGICCQKVGEAEVMAAAGLSDILISYNILGDCKLARLLALHGKVSLRVVADSLTVIEGYASVFTDSERPLGVLVECDTGAARCGVQSAEQAVALARAIDAIPGLRFDGLMTYPPLKDTAGANAKLTGIGATLKQAGLAPEIISYGGSPNLLDPAIGDIATEHRPGTYIYNDRMQVALGWCGLEDCALTVATTVVSRPTETRAVIDAGSKTLTSDLAPDPMDGFGHVMDYPDAKIVALNEEHGMIDLSECRGKPSIGQVLHVIPNHACVVSNLFDEVLLLDPAGGLTPVSVRARGKVS